MPFMFSLQNREAASGSRARLRALSGIPACNFINTTHKLELKILHICFILVQCTKASFLSILWVLHIMYVFIFS